MAVIKAPPPSVHELVMGVVMECFRGLLRWHVLVALIEEAGVVVRLRLRLRRGARHRRPPPTRHRRPPPTPTRSRDSSRNPKAMPRGRSRIPLKTPTAHRGRICRVKNAVRRFGAFSVAFAVLHLGRNPFWSSFYSSPDKNVTKKKTSNIFLPPKTKRAKNELHFF